jgi:hypothetical protein
MKPMHVSVFASIALTVPSVSRAQVAGSTLIGVSVAEAREVASGWSAKRQILGQPVFDEQPVFDDKDERVESIDEIIIAPDKAVSCAIINVGGFIGFAKHDVAIPVSQLVVDNKLVLAGATKKALKSSPPFEHAR